MPSRQCGRAGNSVFGDQILHGNPQDPGDGVDLHIRCDAGLSFQFGQAGGVDVHTQKLHLPDQGGLLHAGLFAQPLDIGTADILCAVGRDPWFHFATSFA